MRDNGIARQHRVAVMAMAGGRLPATRHFVPHSIGDDLMLRHQRPVSVAASMPAMDALHFLQKQNVRCHSAQLFPQFMDDHSPSEVRETLVNVEGGNSESHGLKISGGRSNSSGICDF